MTVSWRGDRRHLMENSLVSQPARQQLCKCGGLQGMHALWDRRNSDWASVSIGITDPQAQSLALALNCYSPSYQLLSLWAFIISLWTISQYSDSSCMADYGKIERSSSPWSLLIRFPFFSISNLREKWIIWKFPPVWEMLAKQTKCVLLGAQETAALSIGQRMT
jgi:hypothetical protein